MKYFTRKLWELGSSPNEEIWRPAAEQFEQNRLKYLKEFEKSKKHLSKKSISILYETQFFHDYRLKEFTVKEEGIKGKTIIEVIMIVYFDAKTYQIHFKDVSLINFNCSELEIWKNYKSFDDIGYLEILTENKELSFECIFVSDTDLLIKAKKIIIKDLKPNNAKQKR